MIKNIACMSFAAAAILSATSAGATEVLTNGDFQLGLTGWTAYTTANGTIAENPTTPTEVQPQDASVVSFDVTGSGASDALFLNAGRINGFGAPGAGGGVSQTFTTTGGEATFYADIAALYTRTSGASDLGLLSVILDGVVMDSHDFGALAAGPATLRDVLGFTANLSAGQHTIALQSTRNFAPARGVFSQYFDNASLDVVAVPEPSTWALMILGFGAAGGALRRRRQTAVAA